MTSGWAYYTDLFRRRWRTVAGAVAAGLAGGAGCSALIIVLIHRQLSGVENDGLLLPALYVASIVLYVVISTVSEYFLLALAQDELRRLRMKLSARILELPLERVEELGGARITASLTDDLARVTDSIRKLTTVVLSGSLLVGVGAYLVWLSPPLFAMTLVVLVVGGKLYHWPVRRYGLLETYFARLREGYDTLLRQVEGLARGSKELLMHRERRREFFREGLQETCDALRDDAVRAGTGQSLVYRMGDVLYYVVLGLALFVLPRLAFVEPDVITGYVIAGLYAIVPVSSILNFGPDFEAARVSLRRLADLGVVPTGEDEPATGPTPAPPPAPVPGSKQPPPRIGLEGLTYAYAREGDDEPFRLGPLDLELRPGELTFLTGGNGSGKTTLFKLLCGLYRPTEGCLRVDGAEVTPADLDDYRQRFSVVFTDFHLFDRFYGLDADDVDRRAAEWLERLELDAKVRVRDGRLSTTDLSEGQRKRLALLTALLEDRPAYLFDEWAADQDPHFKEIFYTELLPDLTARGRTVLAITHDDRWYGTADRILKLADGRLVADRAPLTTASS